MTLDLFNNSDPWSTFSNPIASKQAKMFAFGKIQRDTTRNNDILSSKVTWINTSKTDLKDRRTGRRVKARSIYAGKEGDINTPSWEYPVANIDKLAAAQQVLAMGESASSTDIDKSLNDPFYAEFQEPLKYYNDMLLAEESAAAPMTSQDFPLLQNITIAGQVIVNQLTEFPLLNAVQVENTSDLLFRRYNATGFDIDAIVGELGTTDPKKMAFSKTEFYTRKSGGEIQWSDESEMMNYFINPLELARGQFAIGANKVKATKIAKALSLFTTVSGANLTTFTGEHNTNNPYPFFAAIRKTVNYTNFGNLNQGAMNASTYFAILSNTYVKGIFNDTQGLVGQNGATVQIPGVPGISFVIDETLTDGNVYLFDSNLVMRRIQGPIRTEQYRLTREGGSGLVYRDWNDVQVRDLTKARVLTGLI